MRGNRRAVRILLLCIPVAFAGSVLLWLGLERTNTVHAPATAEGISRILIQVRPEGGGLARREFRADGWVDGGHASGEPEERVYEERERISEEEVEAIWAAATALGEEWHAVDEPPKAEWGGYVELMVIFDDRSYMRLSWPHGEEHPDPRVEALVKLLLAQEVGGW